MSLNGWRAGPRGSALFASPLACPVLTKHHTPMVVDRFVPAEVRAKFEVHEWRNALPLIATHRPQEWADILSVLSRFVLYRSFITKPGKNKSKAASWLDGELFRRGWVERKFDTNIVVDGTSEDVPTHRVDCFKNAIALEVEWNNKDPFFDRDLNNFRLLFDLRVVDVGIIITRGEELSPIIKQLGRWASYGESTTHMSKLLPKLHGGGAGGCPVIAFGIRSGAYVDLDEPTGTVQIVDEDEE